MSGSRLPDGGSAIDRSTKLDFTFDGVRYPGFAGDTLASALLANGVSVVCSSPLQGRPRGVMSAGTEEACAYVAVLEPWVDVICAATTVPLVDGLMAVGRSGVGRLPGTDGAAEKSASAGGPARPPRSVATRHHHVETLVIGGGRSGLAAASAAAAASASASASGYADSGARLMVVQDRPWWGGTADAVDALRDRPDTTMLPNASALGIYDDGEVVVHERRPDGDVIWHVHAGHVVLASGALERPLAFAHNDRPGVMLAGAVSTYIQRYGVLPGTRAVIFTTNDSTDAGATALREAGATVVAEADVRHGWWVASTEGDPALTHVNLTDGTQTETVEADLLAVSGGWSPNVGLARAIGAGLRFDETTAAFVPDGLGPTWLSVVGAAAGDGLPATEPFWFAPAEDLSHHYIDLQRDQSVADVAAAVGRGLRSVEHIKRATYIGTAIDQGRTSAVLTAEIVNHLRSEPLGAQGPTNARPPSVPVSYAALAGLHRGELLDPVRVTPIHEAHVAVGAAFENVGQWRRAWYYAADGENMDQAVQRESTTAREGAGMLDASTLGKIVVVGADAAMFLDRMYAGRISTLAVNAIRYGLLLGLDGMVMDDGTVLRLAEDRFFVTTTTGGAARVLDHFEEFLQTEWPSLQVFCTSITEQWATVVVTGPRAREVVRAARTDIDLSQEAFPFMRARTGTVAGIPARIARISFTGDLSYEVNVASDRGLELWHALLAVGEPFGLAPYGTETMHLLRAEKGYVIVGQDTDGTVTADDLGLSWMVDMNKGDFIGRRSLARPDTARADRKQLVGLLTDDPAVVLPEGAQLVEHDTGVIPMRMIGHVTSSYRSPTVGRPIALAMATSGRERLGNTVFAPLRGGTISATVVSPVFFDPQGARRDG